MTRKKTHEEFVKEIKDKYGDEYTVLGEYVNAKTKVLVKHNCKECNFHEWEIEPCNLLRGNSCPICRRIKQGYNQRKTHEKFVKQLNEVHGEGVYIPLEEYKTANVKILIKHNKCGYEWKIRPIDLLRGQGCPVCSNPPKAIVLGINTIWDTDRWMVDLGVSEEDARRYTHSSSKTIMAKCPDCARNKKIRIADIYRNKSISCTCGDSKSYPEKFLFNLLEQLNSNFEVECSPKWIKPKRYDFYIKDIQGIIETHGEQHYKKMFNISKKTLAEEQTNDKFKRETALANGIKHYIELDCRESNLEYIKNSILNSELSQLFDLSNIDWLECAEFANSNRAKEICEYWNNKKEDETTSDVGEVFKINGHTVATYLKKGTKLGWCNYDPEEEMKKIRSKVGGHNKKKVEIFKNNKSLGVFESCSELERRSEKMFGVKLLHSKISNVCNNKKPQYKGFTFKYIEDNNLNINKIA